LVTIYLLLAATARGAARSSEQRIARRTEPRRASERIRELLLLYKPSSAAGFAPQLLFWIASAMVTDVVTAKEAAMLIRHAPAAWRWVGAITALTAASAYGWAQMFIPHASNRPFPKIRYLLALPIGQAKATRTRQTADPTSIRADEGGRRATRSEQVEVRAI